MTEDQIEALNKSISHWAENETVEDELGPSAVDASVGSCECCLRFKGDLDLDLDHSLTWRETDVCRGCPISEYTDMPLCRGTPYTRLRSVNEAHPDATLHSRVMTQWLLDLRDGKNPEIYETLPYV